MGILDNIQANRANATKAAEYDRQVAEGAKQTKMDLSNMILNGNQEDAIRATQFAGSAGIFSPEEMNGLAASRMNRDMQYLGGR